MGHIRRENTVFLLVITAGVTQTPYHTRTTAAFSHAIASLITFGMPCPRDVAAVALIKSQYFPIFYYFMLIWPDKSLK